MGKFTFSFLFLLNICLNTSFGQTRSDEMSKQIEEIMRARDEMFKMLLDDNSMGSLEKKMEEMIKRFDQTGAFDLSALSTSDIGEYDWIDTPTHKILKLKIKQAKDQPLDIKIEQGMIRLKGQTESKIGSGKSVSKSIVNFERSFSIPQDVDQTNPEFENKDGEVHIKFKKLSSVKKMSNPKNKGKIENERMPVTPDNGDLSI